MDERALERYARALAASARVFPDDGGRTGQARMRAGWESRWPDLVRRAGATIAGAPLEIGESRRGDQHAERARGSAQEALKKTTFAVIAQIGGRRASRWRANRVWDGAAADLAAAWMGPAKEWEQTLELWALAIGPKRAMTTLGQAREVVAAGAGLWSKVAKGERRWVRTEALARLDRRTLEEEGPHEWEGRLVRQAHTALGSPLRPSAREAGRALARWPLKHDTPPLVAATLDPKARPLEGDGEWGRALRFERYAKSARTKLEREGAERVAAKMQREGKEERARIRRLVAREAARWRAERCTSPLAEMEEICRRWEASAQLPGDGRIGDPTLEETRVSGPGWLVRYTGPEAVMAGTSKYWGGERALESASQHAGMFDGMVFAPANTLIVHEGRNINPAQKAFYEAFDEAMRA